MGIFRRFLAFQERAKQRNCMARRPRVCYGGLRARSTVFALGVRDSDPDVVNPRNGRRRTLETSAVKSRRFGKQCSADGLPLFALENIRR